MKCYLAIIFIILPVSVWAADMVVYQSQGEDGVPLFTSIPPEEAAIQKTIDIPNDAINPPKSQSEQSLYNNTSVLDHDLQTDNHEAQLLKDRLEATQANLETAELRYQQAQQAMNRGDYKIGNDTVIDDRYIRMLEINVTQAEQEVATAQENYSNFVNQMP